MSCNASYRHKCRGCDPEQKWAFAAEFSRPSPRQGPRNSVRNFGYGTLVSCNASYRHKCRGCDPEQKWAFAAEFSRPSPRQGPRNSVRNFGYGTLVSCNASYRHKCRGCDPEQKWAFAAEFSRPSPRQGPRNSVRNFGYGTLAWRGHHLCHAAGTNCSSSLNFAIARRARARLSKVQGTPKISGVKQVQMSSAVQSTPAGSRRKMRSSASSLK